MGVVIGVDVGTTKITSLALDVDTGDVLAVSTSPNDARVTSAADEAHGRSEWNAERILQTTCQSVRDLGQQLGARRRAVIALGITGQQHGVVVVDDILRSRTPFINWQDRRGEEDCPGTGRTFTQEAIHRTGEGAAARTGCRLATGYLGLTLFWLRLNGLLPSVGTACFIADWVASQLTGERPATEPSNAGSSGIFDSAHRRWDLPSVAALELPDGLLPPVREADQPFGAINAAGAAATGLAVGVPVAAAVGDNQASFIGSVADLEQSVLVNVGTGGQVAAYTDRFLYAPPLETRPFPFGGNLLVNAGLCGGYSYAVLEKFFRAVGEQLFGLRVGESLFDKMNALAGSVPGGAGGLECEPLFTGTRHEPERRAVWSGASPENWTPGHVVRALLEGMARVFRDGYEQISQASGTSRSRLAGAGNGLRENAVLAQCIAERFGLPLALPRHREEAAVGAALLATVATGIFPTLAAAARLVRSP